MPAIAAGKGADRFIPYLYQVEIKRIYCGPGKFSVSSFQFSEKERGPIGCAVRT
jgi:hypothetical protein